MTQPSTGKPDQALSQEQFADLPDPDTIPNLSDRLDFITSIHWHKYHPEKTISEMVPAIKAVDRDQRTTEQQQVLLDCASLGSFTKSVAYVDVYSPEELHSLATNLRRFRQKNRPDFDGVEGDILDILASRRGQLPANIEGAIKRAERNEDNRAGMQWANLNEFANAACHVLRDQLEQSAERESYIIRVRDPEPDVYPELSSVYQFVADHHVFDILGERSKAASEDRQEAFRKNCQILNEWYAEAAPILNQVPRDIKLERFGAAYQIGRMVETMNNRLNGNESRGRNKRYGLDPVGAINLQKRIGHSVEHVREQLREFIGDGVRPGDQIIPLD